MSKLRLSPGTVLALEARQTEDTIQMNVPLFIRCLEFARESIKTDVQLHQFAERVIRASTSSTKPLTMDAYKALMPTPAK